MQSVRYLVLLEPREEVNRDQRAVCYLIKHYYYYYYYYYYYFYYSSL